MKRSRESDDESKSEEIYMKRWLYRDDWRAAFEQLQRYKQRYGDCKVAPERDYALHQWTVSMKGKHNRGQLHPDLVSQLDGLGFPWSTKRTSSQDKADAMSRIQKDLFSIEDEISPAMDPYASLMEAEPVIREEIDLTSVQDSPSHDEDKDAALSSSTEDLPATLDQRCSVFLSLCLDSYKGTTSMALCVTGVWNLSMERRLRGMLLRTGER